MDANGKTEDKVQTRCGGAKDDKYAVYRDPHDTFTMVSLERLKAGETVKDLYRDALIDWKKAGGYVIKVTGDSNPTTSTSTSSKAPDGSTSSTTPKGTRIYHFFERYRLYPIEVALDV